MINWCCTLLQEVEYDFPDVANIGAPTAIVCIVHLIAQGCPPRNTRCLHDNAPTVIVSNDRPMHTRTSFTTFNTCISDVFILYTHRSRDQKCARRGHASASANDATAFYADSTFSAFCHKGLVSGGWRSVWRTTTRSFFNGIVKTSQFRWFFMLFKINIILLCTYVAVISSCVGKHLKCDLLWTFANFWSRKTSTPAVGTRIFIATTIHASAQT